MSNVLISYSYLRLAPFGNARTSILQFKPLCEPMSPLLKLVYRLYWHESNSEPFDNGASSWPQC